MINKVAIISDIHSNSEALEAVLFHAEKQSVDDVWFLGDAVGYGPDPNRCVRLLKNSVKNPDAWLLGNHDQVMQFPPAETRIIDNKEIKNPHLKTQFEPIVQYIGTNRDTYSAYECNYDTLFPDRRDFLLSQKLESTIDSIFFLVHGGIRFGTPTVTYIIDRIQVKNEFLVYIYKITEKTLNKLKQEKLNEKITYELATLKNQEIKGEDNFFDIVREKIGDQQAYQHEIKIKKHSFFTVRKRFEDSNLNIFLFGHTHRPACYQGNNQTDNPEFFASELKPANKILLDDKYVWYLNPGSVGQPRDGDRRASYMVLDRSDNTVELHRVEYKIRATQKQMGKYDMPENLIKRLSVGR